jgi:hypothetical protein
MPKTIVHTFKARGNVLLEIVREDGSFSPGQMHREIQWMLTKTVAILTSKGIRYSELKTALTPQHDRREVALVFDTSDMVEDRYDQPIHRRVLPLLNRNSSRSILAGDYVGENSQQTALYKLLSNQLTPTRDIIYRYSNQFYIVFINNLTDAMIQVLHEGLQDFAPYSGLADITYSSGFKSYLSVILPSCYIQHHNTIICAHEDDLPDSAITYWDFPFEDFGYRTRSVPQTLRDVLLSYKIERPVIREFGDELDIELSLNAVTPNPVPLEHFEIEIDEQKFDYLQRKKAHSLLKIGLLGGDATTLKTLIRANIASNYIYSMAYNEDYDTTQFNIILEFMPLGMKPFRVLVGLKYIAEAKRLQLITLF